MGIINIGLLFSLLISLCLYANTGTKSLEFNLIKKYNELVDINMSIRQLTRIENPDEKKLDLAFRSKKKVRQEFWKLKTEIEKKTQKRILVRSGKVVYLSNDEYRKAISIQGQEIQNEFAERRKNQDQ